MLYLMVNCIVCNYLIMIIIIVKNNNCLLIFLSLLLLLLLLPMMMCCSFLFVLLVAVAVIDVCLSVCLLFLFCFVFPFTKLLLFRFLAWFSISLTCSIYIQYCAKVTQANFDEFLGFSWLLEEISLQTKFPRLGYQLLFSERRSELTFSGKATR